MKEPFHKISIEVTLYFIMTMKSEYYSLIQIQKVFLKKNLPRSAEIINLKKRKFETEFWQNKHGLREKKNRERTKSGKYSASKHYFLKIILTRSDSRGC